MQVLPFISAGLQEVLQHIGALNDNTQTTNSEWRHVHLVFEPTAGVEIADRAITTMDVVNITNGSVDNSWTDGDYTVVETAMTNLGNAWCQRMQAGYTFKETRYYRRSFNPMSNPKPFTLSGPPDRIYPHNIPGGISDLQARQVSFTTTDRTTYPRHWGRNYWPFPAASSYTPTGLIASSQVNAWGQFVKDQYDALQVAQFYPVVPVTQVQGIPTRGLLTVTSVQMDDVPDVVRRRRNKSGVTKFKQP